MESDLVISRIAWMDMGEAAFETELAKLGELQLSTPSLLPDWSKAMLVSHVNGNATALTNLCVWALTGVETPMYPSPEFRAKSIAEGSTACFSDLLNAFRSTSAELRRHISSLTSLDWTVEVRTARGRQIQMSEVPLMRARETWIHLFDLGTGRSLSEMPDSLFEILFREGVGSLPQRSGGRAFSIEVTGGEVLEVAGLDEPVRVRGDASEVLAWLLGRGGSLEITDAEVNLGPWL